MAQLHCYLLYVVRYRRVIKGLMRSIDEPWVQQVLLEECGGRVKGCGMELVARIAQHVRGVWVWLEIDQARRWKVQS